MNTTSSGEYYTFQTNGTTFKLTAVPESEKYLAEAGTNPSMFQVGNNLNLDGGKYWVLIPGNPAFGTTNFWVMKYDAVCSNGEGSYINDNNTGYDTYSNSTEPCTSANGRQIASLAGGWPIAYIKHTEAVSYCQSIGAHLLTNDEYMTIVTNAANQGSDWSGGSVGSGQMSIGNANSGAAEPEGVGSYGTGYSDFAHLRTETLSNGTVIWDMAGNVWQHVQRSVMNQGDLTTTMALPACSNGTAGWEWCEFASPGSPYISAWSTDVAAAHVAPPNSSWYSANGMGQVYTYGTGANQGTTVFLRGDSWLDGSTGPFALYLHWGTGAANINVGFRCAR